MFLWAILIRFVVLQVLTQNNRSPYILRFLEKLKKLSIWSNLKLFIWISIAENDTSYDKITFLRLLKEFRNLLNCFLKSKMDFDPEFLVHSPKLISSNRNLCSFSKKNLIEKLREERICLLFVFATEFCCFFAKGVEARKLFTIDFFVKWFSRFFIFPAYTSKIS